LFLVFATWLVCRGDQRVTKKDSGITFDLHDTPAMWQKLKTKRHRKDLSETDNTAMHLNHPKHSFPVFPQPPTPP
jgi:hypothetical protein